MRCNPIRRLRLPVGVVRPQQVRDPWMGHSSFLLSFILASIEPPRPARMLQAEFRGAWIETCASPEIRRESDLACLCAAMESADVTPLSIFLIFSCGAVAGALLTALLLGRSSKAAPWLGEMTETTGESRLRAARAEALLADSQRQLGQLKEEASALQERLTAAESARAGAEARCSSAEKSADEQGLLLDRAKELMSDAFRSLASDALASNSNSFFAMMDQKLAGLRVQTEQLWEEKRSAIDHLLRPLNETLSSYQKETRELQGSHIRDLGAVGEQLKSLACAQLALQSETARLVNALKSPQVRGRWGQVQLRRLVELSGMSLHCDFSEEHSVTTRQGRFRPDMVVHLPAEREVV